jgi:hypothetical protein
VEEFQEVLGWDGQDMQHIRSLKILGMSKEKKEDGTPVEWASTADQLSPTHPSLQSASAHFLAGNRLVHDENPLMGGARCDAVSHRPCPDGRTLGMYNIPVVDFDAY